MFSCLMVCLYIDNKYKRDFDNLLLEYSIPISGGRVPRRIGEIFIQQEITSPCFYLSEPSIIFEGMRYTEKTVGSWQPYIDLNNFINIYLQDFENLKFLTNYLLPESSLILKFDDYIQQKDIQSFSSKTIKKIAELGLGVSYAHS